MESLHLPITLHMIGSGLEFPDAKCSAQLLDQCQGEVRTMVTQKFGRHSKHCDEPLIQDLSHGLGGLIPHDKCQGIGHKVISDH